MNLCDLLGVRGGVFFLGEFGGEGPFTGDVEACESELGKLGNRRTMIPSRIITPEPKKPVAERLPGRSPTFKESIPRLSSSLSRIGVGELAVVVGVGGIAVSRGCISNKGEPCLVDSGGGIGLEGFTAVSYTHLTLPTNREV